MTYKDINGLKNYEDMYRAFQDYEDESAGYEASAREGDADLYLLRKAISEFRTIIGTIINEFVKTYPMCEVTDTKDGRSIPKTLISLRDNGHIDEKTRKLLSSINHFGNVGDHPIDMPLKASDYSEISSIYQELLYYMPTFLKQFPKPGDAANGEQARYCRYCGSPLDANAKFCSKCGAPVLDSRYENSYRNNNFDDQYTYSGFYEDKDSSERHRNQGIIIAVIVIAFFAVVGLIHLGRNSSSSEGSVVEKESVLPEEDDNEIDQGISGNDQTEAKNDSYNIGETWTVDGEWELTIDSVTAEPYTYDTNSYYGTFSNRNTEQEYQLLTISYHYTNLGYENYYNSGLSISLANGTIVDTSGQYAQQIYVNTDMVSPPAVGIDETGEASQEFLVGTVVHSATLTYTYPGTDDTAVFNLNWEIEQ